MMMLNYKNKFKRLFLFAFFVLIGSSVNYINAQEVVIDQISDNKFQFNVVNLPHIDCSCPDKYNDSRFTYFWRFGDGGYSKKKNPIYEYFEAGNFNVLLEVTPIYTDEPPERIAFTEPLVVTGTVGSGNWTSGFFNDNSFPLINRPFKIDRSVDAIVPGETITYIITVNQNTSPAIFALTDYNYNFDFVEEEGFNYTQANYITQISPGTIQSDFSIGWVGAGNDSHYKRIFVTFQAPESDEIGPGETFTFGLSSGNDNQYLTDVTAIGWAADMVRTSFDPNEKKVNYDYIQGPETLEYEVHFQNYGDGPTSIIQITDEIHPLLDFDALEFLEVQIGNTVYDMTDPNTDLDYSLELDQNERTFEMTLNEAHLEGTGNPAYSECANEFTTGYVKYAIPTIDFDETTLSNGSVISNQASIVFDINYPIATETVFTQIDYDNDNCPMGATVFANYQDEFQTQAFILTTMELEPSERVLLDAGRRITLNPGAFFHSGSVLLAKIGGCTTSSGSGSKFEGTSNNGISDINGVEGLTSYPNPFTDQTKIKFNLDESSRVSLDIYSLDGRHMVNLIDDEYRNKGKYALRFTDQLNSGAYLLMLQTDTERRTFKLLKSDL